MLCAAVSEHLEAFVEHARNTFGAACDARAALAKATFERIGGRRDADED